jgi:hypothetical protein
MKFVVARLTTEGITDSPQNPKTKVKKPLENVRHRRRHEEGGSVLVNQSSYSPVMSHDRH